MILDAFLMQQRGQPERAAAWVRALDGEADKLIEPWPLGLIDRAGSENAAVRTAEKTEKKRWRRS